LLSLRCVARNLCRSVLLAGITDSVAVTGAGSSLSAPTCHPMER
jgi:hypothetical protein